MRRLLLAYLIVDFRTETSLVALEEENTLLQAGIIETSDVESKDTLYRLMSTITCSIAMAICLSASSTENDLIPGSTSSSFCALISCSLMRRLLLAYLIVDFRTETSLVELWFWTVSRWDI
jgi:hypothetical protein